MSRSLVHLTWGLLAAALAVTAALLFAGDPSEELVGSIWTVWGLTVLVTAVNFWFGSSAGRGRDIGARAENRPTEKQEETE